MPDDELVDKKKNKKENSPDTPKEKNKIKNPHKHARAKTETLEQRRQDFIGQLEPFADIYGREMTDAFANYWTEPNRSLSRMRFELQRTWCLSMRLATWARNEKKFFRQPTASQRPSPADNVAQAQQRAIEESERVVREAEQARELRRQMLVAQGLISDHGGQGTQMLLPF